MRKYAAKQTNEKLYEYNNPQKVNEEQRRVHPDRASARRCNR